MKHRLRAPSPSMAIALLALFVALGGTAYAAVTLPKNSVGTKQLKKHAVTAGKIHPAAVTSGKIKDRAIGRIKIKKTTLASLTGLPDYNVVSTVTTSTGTSLFHGYAVCPAGETAVGGGYEFDDAGSGGKIWWSIPYSSGNTGSVANDEWYVGATADAASKRLIVYADCATV